MAEEVKKEFSVEAKLAADLPGGFDVIVDGKTVYSMAKTQRYPKEGEIAGEIRKLN